MKKINSSWIGKSIIYALCLLYLAAILQAEQVPSKPRDLNINPQFESETQNVIPIKTTIIYTPPINQQYKAVQTVYPKVSNRFQKKVDPTTLVNNHRINENIEKLDNNKEKKEADKQSKRQSKQQQETLNVAQQGQKKSNEGKSKQIQTQISFKANFPYSFTPAISDSYDITKQIYGKETPAQNNRFNKGLSADWFVSKILKKRQVQQSQKQKVNPDPNPGKQNQKIQIKQQAKKDQATIDPASPSIKNPGVIEWKASQKLQPNSIHQYDKNLDVPIIKGESTNAQQKKDGSSLKPHQKVPEVNIVKENPGGDTQLHVSTINDQPNLDKPTKKDSQLPAQNINGNLKQNFQMPQQIYDQTHKDKEASKNNLQVQKNRFETSEVQDVWLAREKYIFIIMSLCSLGIIFFGNKQRQRVTQQSRVRSQYSTIDVKDSNQINEQIDQIEKAQFQEQERLQHQQSEDLL